MSGFNLNRVQLEVPSSSSCRSDSEACQWPGARDWLGAGNYKFLCRPGGQPADFY